MTSQKYGRTYNFPFSPGTTSDDRINHKYREDIQRIVVCCKDVSAVGIEKNN